MPENLLCKTAPAILLLLQNQNTCGAGALNPVGPLLILVSAAASSFGGHSGLAWMWTLLQGRGVPSSELQLPEIERSRGWMVAAAILAVAFVGGLGPGREISFRLGLAEALPPFAIFRRVGIPNASKGFYTTQQKRRPVTSNLTDDACRNLPYRSRWQSFPTPRLWCGLRSRLPHQSSCKSHSP